MFLSACGLTQSSSSSVLALGFFFLGPPGSNCANLATPPVSLNVVWFEELNRLVPATR